MTSLIACFTLLAATSAAQEPDLTKRITFESVAMPAKRLVADLGTAIGVRLDTSPQTAGEILVVRLADTPAKEALDRIAKAINGEWKQEEGLMRLVRPTANLNREIASERADKVRAIQKELADQVAALNKKGSEAPGAPPIPLPFGLGGESKEILQLLTRLNPGDLVLAERDSRIVFSSSPTRMQKLLPGNLEPLVVEMVSAHNKEAAARKDREQTEPENEEIKKWLELMKSFGFGEEPKPIEGRPAKLLLVVEQPNFIGGTSVTLRLYDATGKVALEKSGSLGMSRFMEEAMEMGKPKPTPPGEDKPIEFSSETTELNTIFQSMSMMPTGAKISKELEAKLARPDLYDPLSFGTSESLLAVAKARNVNLVASLPDSMTSILGMFTGAKTTVNAFMQSLESMDVLNIESAPGWLTISPKWPNEARRHRADRTALAKLIAAAKTKGAIGLDDLAAYAQSSPSPMDESASMTYMMLFAPTSMQSMAGMLDWNAVRFYGTLDLNQRRTLADSGRIAFGSLTTSQRDLAARMLFGPQAGLKIADPNEKPKEERGFMELVTDFMSNRQKDYRQEPTEIMPAGLPAAGYVTAIVAKEPVAQAVDSGPMFSHASLGADELAMFRFFKEDPNMAMLGGMMPTIAKLRLGERTNITLKFFVAQEVLAEKNLMDDRIPMNGTVVGMDSLPADFVARIERRYQAFKKTPFPAFGVGAGSRPPP